MNETDLFIQLTSLEDSPITICVKDRKSVV